MQIELGGEVTLPVVRVSGDLNFRSSPELTCALRKIVKPGIRGIILDLARAREFDFGGIATLVQISKDVRSNHGTLHLVAPPHSLVRLLRMAKLAEIFPTFENVEGAGACFRPGEYATPDAGEAGARARLQRLRAHPLT